MTQEVDLVHLSGETVSDASSGELQPWVYTWASLPRFEPKVVDGASVPDLSKPYSYYVREALDAQGTLGTHENYTAYGDGSLHVINVQIAPVTAVKTWTGGQAQRAEGTGPEAWFTLYRRTRVQTPEEAIIAPAEALGSQAATQRIPLRDSDGTPDTVSVVWKELPMATPEGMSYVYSVLETDSAGVQVDSWQDDPLAPELYLYQASYSPDDLLAVGNSYSSPTTTVTPTRPGTAWRRAASAGGLAQAGARDHGGQHPAPGAAGQRPAPE